MMLMKNNKKNVDGDVALHKFRPAKQNVHNLLNPDVLDDETRKLLLDGIMRPPLLSPLHEKAQEPLNNQRKQWHMQQDNRINVKSNQCESSSKNGKAVLQLQSPSHHLEQPQKEEQYQKLCKGNKSNVNIISTGNEVNKESRQTSASKLNNTQQLSPHNGEHHHHHHHEKQEHQQQEYMYEKQRNGFPCQLRERVHSSSEDLLTAMSARLCDLEKKQKAYQLELHEMHSKMAELRTKYAEECKERQDAENVIVAIYEEKKELEEQLKEMKQFLADYGLHWRGDQKGGESNESATTTETSPKTPQSTKTIANNNNDDDNVNGDINTDCDTASKTKNERHDDHLLIVQEGTEQIKMLKNGNHSPYRKQKRNVTEREKEESNSAKAKCQDHNIQHATNTHYSAKSIDIKLLERNARILSEYVGVKGVVNDGKSGAICDREVVHVVIYANGIVVNEGAFRPYGWPLCDAFLHDLIDGYYPYEFIDKYPDGFPVEVIDKTKEVHPAGVKRNEIKNDVHNATTQAMPGIGRRLNSKKVEEQKETANKPNSNGEKDKCLEKIKVADKCNVPRRPENNNIHELDDNSNINEDQNGSNSYTGAIGKSNQGQLSGNREREHFIDKLPLQLVTSGGHLVNVRESIASLLSRSDKSTKLIKNSDGDINSTIQRISDFEYMYITQFERKAQHIAATTNAARSLAQLRCVRIRLRSGETLLMRFQPDNSVAQIRNELFIALPSLKPKVENDKELLHHMAQVGVSANKVCDGIVNECEENKIQLVELCEPYPLRIFSDHSKSLIDLGITHHCVLCIYTHD